MLQRIEMVADSRGLLVGNASGSKAKLNPNLFFLEREQSNPL